MNREEIMERVKQIIKKYDIKVHPKESLYSLGIIYSYGGTDVLNELIEKKQNEKHKNN